jgi:hypothetical protein
MSSQTAKIVLINKTLRLSSPQLLNDPFDVARVLRIPFTPEQINGRMASELARMVREHAPVETNYSDLTRELLRYASQLTEEQRDELAEMLSQNDTNTDLAKLPSFAELQAVWQDMIQQTRILSLTEDKENTVMWSSYAEAYTGVVLELECLDIYDSVLLLAEPVVYSDEPPTLGTLDYWAKMITGQESFDYGQLFKNLEMTKTTRWRYEREWRVVSWDKNSKDLYSDNVMHPRTFTKIYFGKDIRDQDKSDLTAIVRQGLPQMEIYSMSIDQSSQKLVFERQTT